MCQEHLRGSAKRGSSKLSEETTSRICELLSAGNHVNVACAVVGLGKRTFYDWLDRGNPDREKPADEPYREFRQRIERARDEGEARNVTTIAVAARKDWRAAAWLLERQQPERWARGAIARGGGPIDDPEKTGATDGEDRDPFADLERDELAERRKARDAN